MIRYLTELSLDAFIEAARNVPYQQIDSELFPGIDLWIRRDDLIDPLISGNKAYKLIYNLLEARGQGKDTIVTCGGAWSNHVHATAAAGHRFGFKTIGVIRGERPPALSSMLQDAERLGMELRFVSRSIYRERGQLNFLKDIGIDEGNYWYVPEGGANEQGAKGVQLLGGVIEETKPIDFDECWLACGTGVTLGALAGALPEGIVPVGVPVLKAEQSIRKDAVHWASLGGHQREIRIVSGSHHGGYGRVSNELMAFQRHFEARFDIALDHVYTAKLVYAMMRCSYPVPNKRIARQKRVLMLHTGGTQGKRGLVEK